MDGSGGTNRTTSIMFGPGGNDMEEKSKNRMNVDSEKFKVTKGLLAFGGDFDRALVELIYRADNSNLSKIKDTWPDIWEKGLTFYSHLNKSRWK